jgi:hypothetical protein
MPVPLILRAWVAAHLIISLWPRCMPSKTPNATTGLLSFLMLFIPYMIFKGFP